MYWVHVEVMGNSEHQTAALQFPGLGSMKMNVVAPK